MNEKIDIMEIGKRIEISMKTESTTICGIASAELNDGRLLIGGLNNLRSKAVSGSDVFDSIIEHFGWENIIMIRGRWTSHYQAENLITYNYLLAQGYPKDIAALNTFTGKMSRKYGFDKIEFVEETSKEIEVLGKKQDIYTIIEVNFAR